MVSKDIINFAVDGFAFPTIPERLRQLTTISAGVSMIFDNNHLYEGPPFKIIETNFVERVPHNFPSHYEDRNHTKCDFNFLQL